MDLLADSLKKRRSVLVFAGAGASADSGIPTFRGSSGSWWAGVLGGPILLMFGTPWGWKWIPWIAWPLYSLFMRRSMQRAEPNEFHRLVARLAAEGMDVLVVTQNVDGLFQKAGVPADRVIEQHGTVLRNICCRCRRDVVGDAFCARCGGWPRPAAVLFTEIIHGDVERVLRFDPDATVIVAGLSGAVASADPFLLPRIGKCVEGQVFNINPSPNAYDQGRVVSIRTGCAAAAENIINKVFIRSCRADRARERRARFGCEWRAGTRRRRPRPRPKRGTDAETSLENGPAADCSSQPRSCWAWGCPCSG